MSLLFLLWVICGLLLLSAAQAQPDSFIHWLQYSGSHWFNARWATTAHVQYRTYQPFIDPRVLFTGAEATYTFKSAPVTFTTGHSHLFNRNYVTAEETRFTHENRLYQQIAFRQNLWKTGITHRYQVEERRLTQGYQTRFRYSVAHRVPLGPKE